MEVRRVGEDELFSLFLCLSDSKKRWQRELKRREREREEREVKVISSAVSLRFKVKACFGTTTLF